MEHALDKYGTIILASDYQPEMHSLLHCPQCGLLVYHKGGIGKRQRAHFSHYNGKSDCEYYHHSVPNFSHKSSFSTILHKKANAFKIFKTLGSITLDYSNQSLASLQWHLPIYLSNDDVLQCKISTALGEHQCCFGFTSTPISIPILPQIPIAYIEFYAENIFTFALNKLLQDIISRFTGRYNFFKKNDNFSRLIEPHAPLDVAYDYWLLSRDKLPDNYETLNKIVSYKSAWHNWHIYDVQFGSTNYEQNLSLIKNMFHRNLVPPQPKIFFINPYPNHITNAGFYVFNKNISELQIGIINHEFIKSIDIIFAGGWSGKIHEYTEKTISINNFLSDTFSIYINGVTQANISLEDCQLFNPSLITAFNQNMAYEIFDPEVSLLVQNKEIEFICCDNYIAAMLKNLNPYVHINNNHTFIVDRTTDINCKNFGCLITKTDNEYENINNSICDDKKKLLHNILMGIFSNEELLIMLQSPDKDSIVNRIISHKLTPNWLIPYVKQLL